MKTRLHREDPERIDPIRGWETLLRPSEGPESANDSPANEQDATRQPSHEQPASEPTGEQRAENASSSGSGKSSWNDIATRAIERGYQVIEEQINEGRRIAERARGYSDDVRKVNDDASRLVERSMRFCTDVGYLWFELMESMLRSQALRADSQSRNGENGGESQPQHANGNGSSGTRRHDVEIEVISSSPTSVALDLKSAAGRLAASPLHSLDDRKPPLTDIRFRDGANGPVLRIKIPHGQPADTYSGVVVDSDSHQPKGTLCVSIRSDEPPV